MKRIILLILILFVCHLGYSQIDESQKAVSDTSIIKGPEAETKSVKVQKDLRPIKDRLAFGLGTSFWINVNTTYFELAPMLAYRFPKTLTTGMGYRYIYRHDRIWGKDLDAYGPNFFARANLLKRLYFWTEYEILTSEYLYEVVGQDITTKKSTSDSWFAGLGFVRSIGKKGRGGISLQVLYNFLYQRDDYSPYYGPVTYRIGYFF
jgi:hypothetical protein